MTQNVLANLLTGCLIQTGRQAMVPLYVAEGGSRAWGYATEQSDYDVKFVYRRPAESYQTLFERKDHTQFILPPMYDYTGWDVTKFLRLLYKGNAQTAEVMLSPIVYFDTMPGIELKQFTIDKLKSNLLGVAYHYLGLTHSTYKSRMVDVAEPTLKKWFYITRPLLAVEQIVNEHRLPTMNLDTLLEETKGYKTVPNGVYETVKELLTLKRNGELTKDNKGRLENLEKWALDRTNFYFNDKDWMKNVPQTTQNQEEYDTIYRRLVF